MTLDLKARYPGRVITTDPNYPLGKARNRTNPGDGTGTPWEADLANDLHGTIQALLDAAGIAASGSADRVGASDVLDALDVLYQREPVFGFITLNAVSKTSATPFELSLAAGSSGVSIVGGTSIQLGRTGTYLVHGSFNVEPSTGADGLRINAYLSGSGTPTYYFTGIKIGTYAHMTGAFPLYCSDTATLYGIHPLGSTLTPEDASPSTQQTFNQIFIQRIGD